VLETPVTLADERDGVSLRLQHREASGNLREGHFRVALGRERKGSVRPSLTRIDSAGHGAFAYSCTAVTPRTTVSAGTAPIAGFANAQNENRQRFGPCVASTESCEKRFGRLGEWQGSRGAFGEQRGDSTILPACP
jgi:hypothetical protein